LYLEIHDVKDGLKTFGAETRYDFYCVKNELSVEFLTTIKGQDGVIETINLTNTKFIPNSKFKSVIDLVAVDNEETVNVLRTCVYHTQKEYISKDETNTYEYPCVYTIGKGDKINLRWSSLNDRGHFGVPKLIWSNGRIKSVGSVVDVDGEYGLTEFSYAIIDEPNNLQKIKRVFDSKKFRDLMEACSVGHGSINRKVIEIFRKDFWIDFI